MTLPSLARAFPDEGPAGLASTNGLDEVEAAMIDLAVGVRVDRLGRMVQEHLDAGGRRMRARLAMASAEALGLDRRAAIPLATACELLHNATLVHDDIQDGDRLRRGRPTLWAVHGAEQALNAGDLLLMLPMLALDALDTDHGTRWQIARAIASAAERTVRGQAREMELVAQRRLDWASWALAADGKSGALLALPVESAAILAGWQARTIQPLARAFRTLGVLYQAHDDVIDLWGDKGRCSRGNDLREGKASAVVASHLEQHPEDADEIVALLRRPRAETTDDQVDDAIARFESGGALERVARRIATLERAIEHEPILEAVPVLMRVAEQIVHQLRATAPPALTRWT